MPIKILEVPVKRGGATRDRLIFYLMKLMRQHGGSIVGGYARWALSPQSYPVVYKNINIYPLNSESMNRLYDGILNMRWRCRRSSLSIENRVSFYNDDFLYDIILHTDMGKSRAQLLSSGELSIDGAVLSPDGGFVTDEFIKDEAERRIAIRAIIREKRLRDRIYGLIADGYILPDNEARKIAPRTEGGFDIPPMRPTSAATTVNPPDTPWILGWRSFCQYRPELARETFDIYSLAALFPGMSFRVRNNSESYVLILTNQDIDEFFNTPQILDDFATVRRVQQAVRFGTTTADTNTTTTGVYYVTTNV